VPPRERHSLRRVWLLTRARVFGVVSTIVRDPGTAEDVAQETFVRAWRHAGTYDPRRGRVATWLLTIARNAALDRRTGSWGGAIPANPYDVAGIRLLGERPGEVLGASIEGGATP
jgi:RNA polymerase sigma factor (sigma-70 family)